MKELEKTTVRNSVICTAAASIAGLGLFKFVSKKFLWLYIIFSIIISGQINKKMMDASYHRIVDRHKK